MLQEQGGGLATGRSSRWPLDSGCRRAVAAQHGQIRVKIRYSVTCGGGGAITSVTWRRFMADTGAPDRSVPQSAHEGGSQITV